MEVPSERTRGNEHKLKYSQFCLEIKRNISPIYCKGYQTVEQFGRTAGVFSVWGDIQNLTGHTPGNLLQLTLFFVCFLVFFNMGKIKLLWWSQNLLRHPMHEWSFVLTLRFSIFVVPHMSQEITWTPFSTRLMPDIYTYKSISFILYFVSNLWWWVNHRQVYLSSLFWWIRTHS